MKSDARLPASPKILQLHKHAAHFLNLVVLAHNMLVAQQVSKPQLPRLGLGFRPRMERSVLSPKLLCRVAGHPENVFVFHPQTPSSPAAARRAASPSPKN